MLYQEAIIWKRLDHKNIVSFLGTTATPLQIISGWMPGGNLVDYIGKHPEANRLGLVGIPLSVIDLSLTPAPDM